MWIAAFQWVVLFCAPCLRNFIFSNGCLGFVRLELHHLFVHWATGFQNLCCTTGVVTACGGAFWSSPGPGQDRMPILKIGIQLRDLKSLLGKLNFACRIIPMGRIFCRRLAAATPVVSCPLHCVRLMGEHRSVGLGAFLGTVHWEFIVDGGPIGNV